MIPQIFSYLPLSNFYTRRSCFSQRLTFNDPLTLTPNEKEKIYLVLLVRYTTPKLTY